MSLIVYHNAINGYIQSIPATQQSNISFVPVSQINIPSTATTQPITASINYHYQQIQPVHTLQPIQPIQPISMATTHVPIQRVYSSILPQNVINNNINIPQSVSMPPITSQTTQSFPIQLASVLLQNNNIQQYAVGTPINNQYTETINTNNPGNNTFSSIPMVSISTCTDIPSSNTSIDINDTNSNTAETEISSTSNIRAFKCNLCDKIYKKKVDLKSHLEIHNDTAYKCKYCGRPFARKDNLAQHTLIHTNEKPFKCSFCSKQFRQKHTLIDHERLHTGQKPFECEYCHKRFAAKCNLITHRRIHTGERPYECKPCNKRYASKSGYNSHMKRYHNCFRLSSE